MRGLEAGLGDAQREGGDADAAAVEDAQGVDEAVAFLARAGCRRGCGSPRRRAPRCPRSARRACPPSCRSGSPACPARRRRRRCPSCPCALSVTAMTTAMSARRPLVMKVLEPFSTQPSPSRTAVVLVPAGVGARAVLGEAPAPDLLAPGQGHQVLLLLLLGAGQEDVAGAEAVVGGHGEGHPGVHARQLLHDDRVVERGHARAAVLRGPDHAHEAQLAELGEDLARELLLSRPTRARAGASSLSANSRTVFLRSCCSSLRLKSNGSSSSWLAAEPDGTLWTAARS